MTRNLSLPKLLLALKKYVKLENKKSSRLKSAQNLTEITLTMLSVNVTIRSCLIVTYMNLKHLSHDNDRAIILISRQ